MDIGEQKIQDDDYSFPYHYVSQFKNGYTQAFSFDWGIYYASGLEFILDKVKQCSPNSILDIGTGDGRLIRELSLIFDENQRILGVDYSERAINMAKALNPTLNFHVMDIISENNDEQFDVVTLIEVLEHIPLEKVDQFVKSITKFLGPDGKLLLTVPHANIPVTRKHFQHFSSESLKKYLEPYFVVEEVIYLDKRSKMVAFIRKILQNQYFILNHWGIRKRLYSFYKNNYLITDEKNCGRIFIMLHKK